MTDYLTAADVADRFGVNARTVTRWVEQGALVALRLPGGQFRFRDRDLDDFERSRLTQPRPERRRLASLSTEGGA